MQNLVNRRIVLAALLALYLGLACWQLALPGLHYDEAAEAGVNAMQLLTGAPLTAFRDATVSLFGWTLPLMVQDYIGALNVYLALPFLAASGIGVPNLRIALAFRAGGFRILDFGAQRREPSGCPILEWLRSAHEKSKIQNPKSKIANADHTGRPSRGGVAGGFA
jgi:hypothetical protein